MSHDVDELLFIDHDERGTSWISKPVLRRCFHIDTYG